MECLEQKIALARQPILTRKRFLESYSSNVCARQGLAVLDRYDLFDASTQAGEECLAYESRKLPLLTILGVYTHFAGSLGVTHFNEEGHPSKFFASLGKGRKNQPALLEIFQQQLGLTFSSEATRNVFSHHGSSYARLLYLLSFSTSLEPSAEHRNTKSGRGALLPQYLTRLAHEYNTFNAKGQRLALRYLRDVLAVFVDTCASTSVADSTIRLNLPSHPDESTVRAEAAFLMKSFEIAYPSLLLTDRNVRVFPITIHMNLAYQGYFTLDARQIFNAFVSNPQFPARIRIITKPYFSFQCLSKKRLQANNMSTKLHVHRLVMS